jgi:hypothetical protein
MSGKCPTVSYDFDAKDLCQNCMREGEEMSHWTDALVRMNACPAAVDWARCYPTLTAAWKACKRGDWMLWLIGKCTTSAPWSEERKPIVRVALECARLAPWIEDDTTLARIWCLSALERWLKGEAKRDEVNAAAYAAADAADAAYAAYAAYAADAAAYAADAAAYVIVRRYFPRPPRLSK